jgi:ribosomal-protein-alanine N-acetyltransferase
MPAIPSPDRPLTDGVVTLREWEVADAAAMRKVFLDPEMYRWTDADPDETVEEFEQAIQRGWARRDAGERICFAIIDSAGEVAGAIDLMMGEFERGEIGYAVGNWARRQGFATRAVRVLSIWAFEAAGVPRLELPIPLGNAPSRTVAERAGFTYEGVLRSYLWLREGAERLDVAMYSLVPGDMASD